MPPRWAGSFGVASRREMYTGETEGTAARPLSPPAVLCAARVSRVHTCLLANPHVWWGSSPSSTPRLATEPALLSAYAPPCDSLSHSSYLEVFVKEDLALAILDLDRSSFVHLLG